MKTQIKNVSVFQTSKVFAAVSLAFYIPFAALFIIIAIASGQVGHTVFLLFMPIIYSGLAFLMMALFIWIYNIVADKVGGIEITLEHSE